MEREKKMMEQQIMLLQQKQKLLEMQAQSMKEEKQGAAGGTSIDFKVNNVKETHFESPTEEEIKELMEKPRPLAEKKES